MSQAIPIELEVEVKQELERQLSILRRGVVEIVPEADLIQKLVRSIQTGIPLRVKLGLDPTAPDIHLGHTVVLQKLRQFQELGHQVVLLIGDFTGRIGDPTGKSETRKQLSEEDVKRNAQTYVRQFSKVLDTRRVELRYNSEWLSSMNFSEVIQLSAKMTVARMLERDDFEKRFTTGQPISVHEFFYPLMQGYDSVALRSDVELGGTDQKFNLLMGRHLQKEYGQETQVAIMTPLIEGLDGVQKMSKSLGNYIALQDEPQEMYGKTMSIPDSLMQKYFELTTDLSLGEVQRIQEELRQGKMHPRDGKMLLARTLVGMFHGAEATQEAEAHFQRVFQQGVLPQEIPTHLLRQEELDGGRLPLVALLLKLGLVPSKSEGRRVVQQGGVKMDEVKKSDPAEEVEVREGMVLQVGKRKFARIHLEP